jgi:peptide/nickel transport system ATP-binding protein
MQTQTSPTSPVATQRDPLVVVQDLHVRYTPSWGKPMHAVKGVSLSLAAGETLGLVGASGCGKTSLARGLLGLVPVARGSVRIDRVEFTSLHERELRLQRWRAQMVFQDPAASLNPRMPVRALVADPLRAQTRLDRKQRAARAEQVLNEVGLAAQLYERCITALSGGERQRVSLARALVLDPRFLILDEPVSALDTVARVELLDLLDRIQRQRGCAILLVTHDLVVARRCCTRIAVMHAGRIIETGPANTVFSAPQHPRTQRLRAALPPGI